MRKEIRSLIPHSFLLIVLAVVAAVLLGLAMRNRPAPPAPPTAGAVTVPVATVPVPYSTPPQVTARLPVQMRSTSWRGVGAFDVLIGPHALDAES